MRRFNEWLAVKITKGVATMWCAYLFCALACFTLPDAVRGGMKTFVPWCAQTFLQLVLLSVIMVGQDIQSRALHDRHDDLKDSLDSLHQKHDDLHDKMDWND